MIKILFNKKITGFLVLAVVLSLCVQVCFAATAPWRFSVNNSTKSFLGKPEVWESGNGKVTFGVRNHTGGKVKIELRYCGTSYYDMHGMGANSEVVDSFTTDKSSYSKSIEVDPGYYCIKAIYCGRSSSGTMYIKDKD